MLHRPCLDTQTTPCPTQDDHVCTNCGMNRNSRVMRQMWSDGPQDSLQACILLNQVIHLDEYVTHVAYTWDGGLEVTYLDEYTWVFRVERKR